MCLMWPTDVFEQVSTPDTIDGEPTFIGWKFFRLCPYWEQTYHSPLNHPPGRPGYRLGEVIRDTNTYEISYIPPVPRQPPHSYGKHQLGFFIFLSQDEAIKAYEVSPCLDTHLVLAKVRYANPVAWGVDESSQRCVVARTMVIKEVIGKLPLRNPFPTFDDRDTETHTTMGQYPPIW